ncbi:molecular chaperone DnaJ [Parafrankia irregularis]|uniref:Chaperone protein DnaJ n=1 Tax=Parafrankia irregularis TaxID=795642 RepID=A0A0S4QGF9_9ACTN|nr:MULTISPECIES: molecular chaperone DnaJ [Frankiaceae]EFC85889.1 chaperone protein DnaJ [Parafrankia sp. EUN1f]KPM54902.1 molecular chaperone DnaJ [Frankia sp. R43]MBE3199504.1 molecular chaperone DnaJ [Parafrankia sp. CH37]CUU53832.1 molecular chaperone DnaJ [Parafrankia irregularis]
MAVDYYATLGVRRDATGDEIKRAYRKLARELHPDVNPDPEAQQRFRNVTNAYEVLSDPEKRQIVDLGGDPLAPGGGGGGAGSPFGAGFGGLGDIMDAFFGGGASRGPRSRVRRGNDALLRLELDLAETAFGATRDITVDTAVVCPTCTGAGAAQGTQPSTCSTCHGRGEVQQVTRSFLGQMVTSRPCPRCSGTGTVIEHPCRECSGDGRVRKRRTLTVKIPSGVEDGMRIRLSGEGEVGPGGGPPGDLYVEVSERQHAVFTREGDDLHCDLRLPMTAAALGTVATLETLDGSETITVKPGTQPGEVIRLAGRGVPHLRAVGRGHLHIHIVVETPTKLDAEQERLLRELAKLREEESPAVAVGGSSGGSGLFSRRRSGRRNR